MERTGRHRRAVIERRAGAPFTKMLCGKSMTLSDIERKRVERTVGAFVEKLRPAPHIRPQLDFGFRVSGQSVELFEIRPQWDRPTVKRESSFAKATFIRTQGLWKVYWMRAYIWVHYYSTELPDMKRIYGEARATADDGSA